MGMLTRIKSWLGGPFNGVQEGSFRGPFSLWGEFGNRFTADPLGEGWQRHLSDRNQIGIAALHAAISAYVHAFILMPMHHRRKMESGGWEPVTTSALSRWIDKPNYFQTMAEFWALGIRQLMDTGNAVAVAARNDRTEVVSTIWVDSYTVTVDEETGAIFYHVSLNGQDSMVPARDILHLRINAPASNPLTGRSNTVFCAAALATNSRLSAFLVSYLNNRASPSYALSTDANLSKDQMRQLREAWNEQSQMLASGGTPILANGLKPEMLGVAPGDTLLVDTFNLSVEDISRAFSIPKALLGISETASNAENLYRAWISLGLGSMIELVEQGIEKLFSLPRGEEVNFESDAMLRLDAQAQMDIVSRGVTAGVLSPDEGRAKVGYGPIIGGYGKAPAMQQQMVPLDLLHEIHAADIANKVKASEAPAPAQEQHEEDEEKRVNPDVLKAQIINLRDRLRKSA